MSGLFAVIVCVAVLLSFLGGNVAWDAGARDVSHSGCSAALRAASDAGEAVPFKLEDVPAYDGSPSVEVNGNVPFFTDEDRARGAFESYAPLDSLGRCGSAFALIGPETMPKTTRGGIGMVRPSGWQISRYSWVDGEYLFNRCHLIGFLLTGQDANERNLITGTRSMNVNGMLPYEERVASYVRYTGNHVLYRVTPLFEGRNLVASGVLMEAESLEDAGARIRFCVWCYNVEPGVRIDYATGRNWADGTIGGSAGSGGLNEAVASSGQDALAEAHPGEKTDDPEAAQSAGELVAETPAASAVVIDPDATYVLNTGSMKFHRPDCPSVQDMSPSHRQMFYGTAQDAEKLGYKPCGWCRP